MVRSLSVLAVCAGVLPVLGATTPVRADDAAAAAPTQADAAAAGVEGANPEYDALVIEALAAFDAGRWDEARRLFERAHGLHPTARTLRTVGMAAFNQGDFIAALQNLEAALVDSRKPLSDEQRVHVRDLIARADAQLGRYALTLEPGHAQLTVDGKSPALLGSGELLLLPGKHELVVSAPGHETLRHAITAKARDRAPLALELTPTGAASVQEPSAPGPAAPPAPVAASPSDAAGGGAATTWGWVALAVGGVALIASGVTAGLALDEKSELDDGCPERRCPPPFHDGVDRYDTLGLVSGVSFAVGLAGIAVGSILLVSADDGDAGRPALQAQMGPGWVGLGGTL